MGVKQESKKCDSLVLLFVCVVVHVRGGEREERKENERCEKQERCKIFF